MKRITLTLALAITHAQVGHIQRGEQWTHVTSSQDRSRV